MAFGVEKVDWISGALYKAESVQIDGSKCLWVLTTDVYNKSIVDEYPHIVIA